MATPPSARRTPGSPGAEPPLRAGAGDAARQRQARKDLARVESQLAKLGSRIDDVHTQLATHAADYERLVTLGAELDGALARQDELEGQWLELAEEVGELAQAVDVHSGDIDRAEGRQQCDEDRLPDQEGRPRCRGHEVVVGHRPGDHDGEPDGGRDARDGTDDVAFIAAAVADVQKQVDFMVENCVLEPAVDEQLHAVLGGVLNGVGALEAGEVEPGAVAIVQALNAYGAHFEHPGWQDIE